MTCGTTVTSRWTSQWPGRDGSDAAAPSSPVANRRFLRRPRGSVRRVSSRGGSRWRRRRCLVAVTAATTRGHGGRHFTRQRRFRCAEAIPTGDLRRGWRGRDGGDHRVLRFVRGGAARRRLASAAAAIHGVTREKKEREGSSVVFLQECP